MCQTSRLYFKFKEFEIDFEIIYFEINKQEVKQILPA
jgi:hypothetical protein